MTKNHGASIETALTLIEILRAIPRDRYATANQIEQALQAAGYSRSLRTVQRLLGDLVERFPIDVNVSSKPYGYRWAKQSNHFQIGGISPAEAASLHRLSV